MCVRASHTAPAVGEADVIKHDKAPLLEQGFGNGRYRARTCDPQLVELVLSQLS
jgi:hypothetical protein